MMGENQTVNFIIIFQLQDKSGVIESREEKTAVIEKWFRLVDEGDIPELVKRVDERFTEAYEGYFAGSEVKGIEAMREYARNSQSVYMDVKHEVIEHIVEGDKVATRLMFTDTYGGELLGVPVTGNRVRSPMTNVYEVVGGKMRRTWLDYDSLYHILSQIKE